MIIHVPQAILEPYIEAEYDSENLDAIVNRFYLDEQPSKEDVKAALEKMDPSNAYRSLVLKKMNMDEKEAFASIAVGFGLDEIEPTKAEEIENNPYYLLLKKMKPWKEGNVEFAFKKIPAYSLFLSQDKGKDEMIPSQEKTYLSYAEKDLMIPTLIQNRLIWMSLVPHELHTMEKPILEAHGDVLVYGVGLGYYAFMVSEKAEVKSVTIIEKDPQILSLFKRYFLPHFPHLEKIKLIRGDALSYQKKRDIHYSYCFVDIYRGEADGFPLFASLRSNEGIADKTSYWIERALLCYLRRHVCVLLEELAFNGYGEEAYQEEGDASSILLKRLYQATKDIVLNNEEDLRCFLSDRNLKDLSAKLGY